MHGHHTDALSRLAKASCAAVDNRGSLSDGYEESGNESHHGKWQSSKGKMHVTSDGMGQKWKLRRYEALVGVGSTNYFGTIGGSADPENLFGLKDLDIKDSRIQKFSVGSPF